MSPKARPSATSAIALETAAAPARPKIAGAPAGQAGSRDALAKLALAMAELRAVAIQPLLQRAVDALRAEDHQEGTKWALQALDKDERSGFGWYLLAIARERAGDFGSSIECYEKALALLPEHAEVANDLGRLAFRLDMKPQAEKLFRHFLARHPGNPEAVNNLVCAIRDQGRYDEAVETLRAAILKAPENATLWNTMGTIVADQGDYENARIFFGEALKLEPGFHKACYNLGNAHLVLGDPETALELNTQARKGVTAAEDREMMRMAHSTILITLGRLGEGWDEYEARLHPQFHDVTHFLIDRPQWAPGADLAGKTLLVFGEQGLGDEVLFSNTLPDVIERLGPEGKLILAVEPRLVPLFQRSFPQAEVGPHATYLVSGRTVRHARFKANLEGVDLWTPVASLLREFRRTVEAYPDRPRFLEADPERVAHWRQVLEGAPAGVKVGLLWKSGVNKDARGRWFSPFKAWAPVLATPGVTFVNLQYGDCAEELATAEREFGVRIWTPPGIDLKQDLDDVAALCQALDLVVGFSNASFNLGAACGAPSWLISTPGAWTLLGSDRYPWYPQVRTFVTDTLGDWTRIMTQVADALDGFVKGAER